MKYETSIGRVALAMLFGALVGGNLTMGLIIASFGPPPQEQIVQVWITMQAYWLGGVILFTLLPLVLLHISNLRQWYGLTAIGILTMISLSFYAFNGVNLGNGVAILAAIGGIVGWVIWRVAYRRQEIMGETD